MTQSTARVSVSPTAPEQYVSATTPFTLTVLPAVASAVFRVRLEPGNAEITAPAALLYTAQLLDSLGNVIPMESGGSVEFTSSRPETATITPIGGIATGATAGTTTITATYRRDGVLVASAASDLRVYAAGTVGHYGTALMSVQGNARTIRRGESITFQIVVRTPAGVQVTSGITPPPVVTSLSPGVISLVPIIPPFGQTGYFYDMMAAFGAPLGSEVRIRFDVSGAGGELVMRVVP